MARRIALSIGMFAVLSGAAFLILRTEADLGGGGDGGAFGAEPADAAARGPSPAVARLLAARKKGALAGRVVDGAGKGVLGAAVDAQGVRHVSVRSGPGGAFQLDELEPGSWLLFAALGTSASEPVGPVPLGPGEELRDLTLVIEPGAALSGAVLDSRDGKPVPKARVSAGAVATGADERGRYRLAGLPGGTVVLFASAEGYVPRQSEVELVRGRERTGADVHLDRAARVFGVVTAQGVPVSGAEVVAARYGFASRLSSLAPVALTAPDGTFAGFVPPGRMELVARSLGFAEARTEEFELAAGQEREANLSLGQGGQLFGAVRDAEGAGVSGCRVEAWDTVHGRTTAQGTSGPGGQYWIAGVPAAIYLVAACCEAGRAEVSGIEVAEGAQVQVDLKLGAGTIVGRVVDASGKPVAGAVIAVRPDGSAAPESLAGASRADGAFELRGLSQGRYGVSATAAQGRAEKASVPAGTKDLLLALGSAELVGQVVGDRGEPVSDFTVYAEPQQLEGGRPRSQRFLSPIGEFRLSLSPGRYALKVGASGYASTTVPGVDVRAGGSAARVKVTLVRGGTIRGRTVDQGGAPLASVRVATSPNLLYAFGRAAPVPAGASALSDEQGVFVLGGVTPGDRVHLFAAKDGWEQRGPAMATSAVDAETSGVEVRLFPSSRGEEDREFAGVGMTLTSRGAAIQVIEVFEGGPAREAGIRPGDQIIQVDGAPAPPAQLNDVIARIRGVVGTTVTLQLRRDGKDFVLAIPRAVVKF